ncbi:hypothetical protein [Candidatus Dactylopiibacterium carminicum]|uniref:hypothetical protein n=1 Tax=Candidatus Dactylopiibacterium carminicum TaxID=857335 RepID=UPI001141087E|nr:hypothetical protein [Candidatus Dactylopiibacterium carminicum]
MRYTALAFFLLLTSPRLLAQDTPRQQPGRLFYSQQQRHALDEQRHGKTLPDETEQPPVTLHGIVRRSDGHDTVWLNGRAYSGTLPVVELGESNARVLIREGHAVDLKVGETFPRPSGR